MAIFHTYIDDSTPGGEDAVAGIGSDTLYGVFASRDFKVTGISTFSGSTEFEKVKHLKDSTGDIGDSGQILSSTGSGINWINANTTNVNSASNVGINEDSTDAEQWLAFVGAKSGNNPVRVDDDLRYNPSTNVLSVKGITLPGDDQKITIGADDALEIKHDSTSGQVELKSDAIISIMSGNTIEMEDESGVNIARFVKSSGCELYHRVDGTSSLKLATNDTGVTVSGTVDATTFSGALNGDASGSSGSCTGNAATATALATAVNIGGVSFDGSADITPGVAAGLSGTPSIEVTNIDIAGTITDKDDITGNAGQVLTSTSTGVAWANAGTLAAGAAAQVAVSDQSGSEADETCFPVFGLDATGSNIALQSNTALKFNARTGALEATSLVKTSGTSSEFLKADGSVDTNTYLTSQVQSDWDQTTNTADDFIKNKPSIPAAQVQSDWDASSGMGEILNKPTLVTAFTGLSDTPANYTSQTGKFVAVKSDGTGLEFVNNPDTQRGIDTTPAETATTESISSSWAFAHDADANEGNGGHVPAAGSNNSGKFLANDGSWGVPPDTTYGLFTTSANGLAPQLPAAHGGKFLKADGSWEVPAYISNTNTTYGLHCRQDAAGTNNSDDDDPYLWLNASSGTDDSIQIVGGTNCSVTRDGDGQLTISSSATTLLYHNNKLRLEPVASGVQVYSGDASPYPLGTVTASSFSGDGSSLTGLTASQIPTLNQNTTGSSGSCTGNAATATTAASCSGNSATATTAASCTGNSATATAASKSRIRTDNGNAWHNLVFVDSTDDDLDQILKMDDEASRLQWNPNTETLASWSAQSRYIRDWANGWSGNAGQVIVAGGSNGWAWTNALSSITSIGSATGGVGSVSDIRINELDFKRSQSVFSGNYQWNTKIECSTLADHRIDFYDDQQGNCAISILTGDRAGGVCRIRSGKSSGNSGQSGIYDTTIGASVHVAQNDGDVTLCANSGYGPIGGFGGSSYNNGFEFRLGGNATWCTESSNSNPTVKLIRRSSGDAIQFCEGTGLSTVTEIGSITLDNTANTTSFNENSDYRLKENVVNITGALAKINQLRPVNFNFIGKSVKLDGFLAHEVQAVVPYAVHGDKDGLQDVKDGDETSDGSLADEERVAALPTKQVPKYQQLDKSKLIGLLTAAVQELSAKNDALEARIAALES